MSRKKIYHSEKHGDLTIDDICKLKYPIARPATIRGWMAKGMSVDEIIETDLIKLAHEGMKRGQRASKAANIEFTLAGSL